MELVDEQVFRIAERIPQLMRSASEQKHRMVKIDNHWVVDFASCNYLGFDYHPVVREAVPALVESWGLHPSWSRAVVSPQPYEVLEKQLSRLIGAPRVLLFPSITLIHVGVLPLLSGTGSLFVDVRAHHSLHLGAELAQARGAELVRFKHNDPADLEKRLERSRRPGPKVIAMDGVYSMSGLCPDLPAYVRIAKRHGALLYVDDAHGFGIIGEHPDSACPAGRRGNGIAKHYGLDLEADNIVYVAGLSKAYSSMGAFVSVLDQDMFRLLNTASTLVFSGPVPVGSLASGLSGLELNDREGDSFRERLMGLTDHLAQGARALGFEVSNQAHIPIVYVVIGGNERTVEACGILWEHGILITPGIFPAVPKHQCGVRFQITALNTPAQVDQALAGLSAIRQRLFPIPGAASVLSGGVRARS